MDNNDFDYSPENPLIMDALGMTESNRNPSAVGPMTYTGEQAMGLNQIMPATWKEWADPEMDPFNPEDNSKVAKKYLSHLYEKYGDIKLATAAYNAGPGTIDKYLSRTENKTFDEVSAKMEEAGSYEETRKYVPKFLANVEQAKQKQSSQYGAVNTPEAPPQEGMGSKEDFAKTMLGTLGDPLFDVLPASEKVSRVAGIYKSRQWDPDVDDVLKDVTSNIWEGAEPEETPNFNEILGAPPLVKSDENPDDVLENWKITALDELDKHGINPNLFGKQLDNYIDNATQAEKEAFTGRNRTPVNWALNRAGNYVREGAKGVLGNITQPLSGAIRLGGAPFGKGEETADAILNAPEVYLGTPSSDFMYVTDEQGYPKQNPDGSFQTHWQAEAAQGIGMVAGAIGTLGIGAAFGVSGRVLASANIGANTLGLANSSFKTVYDETGDIGKAYTAAAFSLPAGVIGSIGEWGIVSGAFRPALQGLTKYDQARFLGQAFTRNVVIGGVSNAASDVTQQVGEITQTGNDLDTRRTGAAAAIGAVGSGVAGTVFDTIQGRSDFRARENARKTQVAQATNALTSFRNGVDGEARTSIDGRDIPPDVAANLGIEIIPNEDGTTTLQKKSDIVVNEAAEIPTLLEQLQGLATPDEVLAMGKKQGMLASKEIKTPADLEELSVLNAKLQDASRPEYFNNVKAVERAILNKLNEDPSALPVRYEDGAWFNVESGEVAPNLKELLSPKRTEVSFDNDLSDLSYLKIIDEDAGGEFSKSDLNKINKVKLKGLGATITKGTKSEIVLPKGMDEASKREVLAHEVAHVLTNKVTLTPEANLAVEGALADLNVRALVEPASEMAKAVFLPNVRNLVKIPEGVTLKGLEKESQKALTSKREFLANQIGAVILKRGGHDIGDYKIIPEVEAALSKTKLPDLTRNRSEIPSSEMASRRANSGMDAETAPTSPRNEDSLNESEQYNNTTRNILADKGVLPDTPPTKIESLERDLSYVEDALRNGDKPPRSTGREKQIKAVEKKYDLLIASNKKSMEGAEAPSFAIAAKEKELLQSKEKEIADINNWQSKLFEERARLLNEIKQAESVSEISNQKEISIDARSGEQGETAYSKAVRESVPERPANLYDKISILKTEAEADAYVNKEGLAKVIEVLENPESFSIEPRSRIAILEAAYLKADAEVSTNPTPHSREQLYKLDQLRGGSLTVAAQQMRIGQRIKGSNSFGEFLVNIKNIYEEAGQTPPTYTEFMLKELKALYNQTQGLPEGTLRNLYTQKLFEKTLEQQKIKWPEFIKSYIQTNLLSGIGTQAINFEGGAWMGPLVTALSHPIKGNMLLWRAMWNIAPVARANAKLVLEGKAGNALFGGLIDPSPLKIQDNSSIPRIMASYFNKFGHTVWKGLGAMDAFMRTLSSHAYLSDKKYDALKKQFGNDPEKFTAEVSKLILKKADIDAAKVQAEREGAALGLKLTDADKAARAYEILTRNNTPNELIEGAEDWANSVSLRGEVANPVPVFFNRILSGLERNEGVAAEVLKTAVVPFGRAIVRLADYTADFVPGNYALEKLGVNKAFGGKERSQAMKDRLIAGQKIGTGLALTLLGLSRSGIIQLTGDDEIALDRGGEGDSLGKEAKNRAQFKEADQTGIPPYSILINGKGFSYKDIPGFNGVAYGIYQANKALDAGMSPIMAGYTFFRNAFAQSVPFFGGITTLNSPYIDLVDTFLDKGATPEALQKAGEKVLTQTAKMAIPASSLLRDVKTIYDDTPEETIQNAAIQTIKDIPGASEMFGSKPMLNVFGEPVERSTLERIPGANRLLSETKMPSDAVALKALEKGLIIPELQRTVKFNKSDFPSTQFQEKYQASREERLSKAYSGSFTPEEWYDFVKATGPHIKAVTNQVASSALPTAPAQKELSKRVQAIRNQAKMRYIRTGKF